MGFNYGAKKGGRIRETIRTALSWGIGIGLIASVVFFLLPGQLLSLFNASPALLAIGIPAVRIMCGTFALRAVTTILGMCASGLGNGVVNMLGTGLRQVIVLLPCFWLLLKTVGLPVAWSAMWLSEILAMLYCVWSIRREIRKKVDPIMEE